MRFIDRARDKLYGIIDAAERYPLVIALLIAIAIVNGIIIEGGNDIVYQKLIVSMVVGAFLSALLEKYFEVFKSSRTIRIASYPIVLVFIGVYFLLIGNIEFLNTEIMVRTASLIFAIVVGFLLIPIIDEEYELSDILFSTLRALFLSVVFTAVIFLGVSSIIGAIDELLFQLPSDVYRHSVNMVFVLFLPIYFLSLLPDFTRDSREKIEETFHRPKAVEVLVTYVLIPIVSVFTLILALYILRNITGEFWRDNLLEPMLLTYSIAVITLYIFSGKIENRVVSIFRDIFPKILIPIVLFQTASSLINIRELGLTHGRYYAILYGVFATIASITFSIFKLSRNRAILGILIVFSLIAIIPPIDAFTISEKSQVNKLRQVLEENNMLEDKTIVPNTDIADREKRRITEITMYLDRMGYIEDLDYIPEGFSYYEDFKEVFGFVQYQRDMEKLSEYRQYRSQDSLVLDIENYNYMAKILFSDRDNIYGDRNDVQNSLIIEGQEIYQVGFDPEQKSFYVDQDSERLAEVYIEDMIENWTASSGLEMERLLAEEAVFEIETEDIALKFWINRIEIYDENENMYYNGEITVFLDEK